jgi:hypothetical protein
MSNIIYLWHVYCNTDSAWKTVWSPTQPTACPNNNTHSISTTTIYKTNQISDQNVIINEEEIPAGQTPTGGHYCMESRVMTIPAGTTGTCDLSFEFPVTMLGGVLMTDASQNGDKIEIHAAPDSTVGVITSPVTAGDIAINVDQTAADYAEPGLFLTLSNGSGTSQLIRIKCVNRITKVITLVSPGISASFSGMTFVKLTAKFCNGVYIQKGGGCLEIGTLKIGGSYVQAGRVIRLVYENNGANTQVISFIFQFIY